MNKPVIVCLALVICLMGLRAAPAVEPPPAADRRPEMKIVIVDALRTPGLSSTMYERMALVFPEVFAAREWPLRFSVERFAANGPPAPLELRVFFHHVATETPGGLTFRAWMTLYVNGVEHDLGVVRYECHPPPASLAAGTQVDEAVRGAANEVAKRIELLIFRRQKARSQ